MQTPGTIYDENSYQFQPDFAESPGLKHVDRLFNKNRKVNKTKQNKKQQQKTKHTKQKKRNKQNKQTKKKTEKKPHPRQTTNSIQEGTSKIRISFSDNQCMIK